MDTELEELLNQVSDGQRSLFYRLYHQGISNMEQAKQLLRNTIAHNEKRREIRYANTGRHSK